MVTLSIGQKSWVVSGDGRNVEMWWTEKEEGAIDGGQAKLADMDRWDSGRENRSAF